MTFLGKPVRNRSNLPKANPDAKRQRKKPRICGAFLSGRPDSNRGTNSPADALVGATAGGRTSERLASFCLTTGCYSDRRRNHTPEPGTLQGAGASSLPVRDVEGPKVSVGPFRECPAQRLGVTRVTGAPARLNRRHFSSFLRSGSKKARMYRYAFPQMAHTNHYDGGMSKCQLLNVSGRYRLSPRR